MNEARHQKSHRATTDRWRTFRRGWFFPIAGVLALVSALLAAPATPAQTPSAPGRIIGGLPDLSSYCKAKGFQDANWQLVRTVGDWKCLSPRGAMPITNNEASIETLTWDEACDLFYGVRFGDMEPVNSDPDDPAGGVKCNTT